MKRLIMVLLTVMILGSCSEKHNSTSNLELTVNKVEPLNPKAKQEVQNWTAYNKLYKNLATVSNTNALNSLNLMPVMINNVEAMGVQIPETLRNEEVEERIQKIDSQVTDFYAKIEKTELQERVAQRHINEILDAFDDLNKTINTLASKENS